jgi:hypothetical protein
MSPSAATARSRFRPSVVRLLDAFLVFLETRENATDSLQAASAAGLDPLKPVDKLEHDFRPATAAITDSMIISYRDLHHDGYC